MASIVGEDFEGGTSARRQLLNGADLDGPLVLDLDLARGDLAIQAVLGATRRVVVAETNESLAGCGDGTFDLDVFRP